MLQSVTLENGFYRYVTEGTMSNLFGSCIFSVRVSDRACLRDVLDCFACLSL